MSKPTRTCADCGADISDRHGNTKRCEPCSATHQKRQNSRNPDESHACIDRSSAEACRPGRLRRNRCGKHYRRAVKAGLDLTPAERKCLACNTTFRPAREDAVHCSPRCTTATSYCRNRKPNPERSCVECGTTFTPSRSDRIVCSRQCRMRRSSRYVVKGIREFVCAHCSGTFGASRSDAVYCSSYCSKHSYYSTNRERLIAAAVQWAIDNPERMRVRRRARRALKRNNPGSVGVHLRDWSRLVARYRNCCAYCNKSTETLHMDHVIPLALGGRHAIGNVIPACPSCNHSKQDKLLAEWRHRRKLPLTA